MKKHLFSLALILGIAPVLAQGPIVYPPLHLEEETPETHLEGGITLGTTGVGFELTAPLTDFMQLRAGFTFLPVKQLSVSIPIPGADEAPTYNEEGELVANSFERLSGLLEDVTGCTVDDQFKAVVTPSFRNVRLMADFYPVADYRHWHVTAGVMYGPRTLATLVNAQEEAPLVVALNAYNRMYDKALNDDPLLSLGDFDLYNLTLNEKLLSNGRLGVEMGKRISDSTPFMLEPDEQGTIRATVQANAFRPYLGTGYEGYLTPRTKDWTYSIEVGAFYWGVPRVLTTDRCRTLTEKADEYGYTYTEWEYSTSTIDLVSDVRSVSGSAGKLLRLARNMMVYPVIEFRISHRLF